MLCNLPPKKTGNIFMANPDLAVHFYRAKPPKHPAAVLSKSLIQTPASCGLAEKSAMNESMYIPLE